MNSILLSNISILLTLKSVEIIAMVIPVIPKRLPVLDVSGDDNPLNARIKNIPETKYKIAIRLIDSIYFFLPFLYMANILIVTKKPPNIFIAAKKTAIDPTYKEIWLESEIGRAHVWTPVT